MVRHIAMTIMIGVGTLSSSVTAQDEAGAATCRDMKPSTNESPQRSVSDLPLVVSATYIGQAAGNTHGGLRQDVAYAGRILLRSEVDLERLVGVTGGTFRVWFTNRQGRNLVDFALGTGTGVQEIYSPQSSHLSVLTYEQRMFGGRVELEAGRLPANLHFLSSPLCAYLQTNSACGSPTFVFKTSHFTFFPPSSWGARAKGQVSKRLYVQSGVYEVNPDRMRPTATGLEWGVKNAIGVIVPFELGYTTTSLSDRLPRTYQIGGWYDAAKYSDPAEDDIGGLAILSGRRQAIRHGRSGAYLSIDQMVWRPTAAATRGLRLFGLVMNTVSGRVIQDRFLQFGLLYTGTFTRRPADTVAFVINDQAFSQLALRNIRVARSIVGDGGSVPRHQIMMELAYGVQVTAKIRVSPNLHYIVNPDQLADPFRTHSLGNVFVVGVKFTVDVSLVATKRTLESARTGTP
jgi:porin